MSLRTTSTVRSDGDLALAECAGPGACVSVLLLLPPLSVEFRPIVFTYSFSDGEGDRGRPRLGSRTKSKTYCCISGERKLPCIVDTPFGGWAGIMSTPKTLPFG